MSDEQEREPCEVRARWGVAFFDGAPPCVAGKEYRAQVTWMGATQDYKTCPSCARKVETILSERRLTELNAPDSARTGGTPRRRA